MNKNDFKILEKEKEFNTFYFIESHLKSINDEISLKLDSSGKHLNALRKISEKEFEGNVYGEDYIVSVYGIDFKRALINKKDIKYNEGISTIKIKVVLKTKKNKFESHNYVIIDHDSFCPKINFEIAKKLFGKDQIPPEQMKLTNLQIIQIFSDALLIKERRKINDITYIELMKYGIKLLKQMDSYEMVLYLMLYTNIVNSHNLELIQNIFEIFDLNKIIKPLDLNCLLPYEEKLEILYSEQNTFFDKVKKIEKGHFREYLINFYTIYFNLTFTLGNFQQCEKVMKELRDNNPYDNLITARLYLSKYYEFYKNIPISSDMKNSLIEKFISAFDNFEELCRAFNLIAEYINYNFQTLLLIIARNYDKIHKICFKYNNSLNINCLFSLNESDDLSKIQNSLNLIKKYKLKYNFKAINLDNKMWDFYLLDKEKNKEFWEFLKSFLIEGSLNYDEVVDSLHFIEKHTKRSFVEMIEIIKNHYKKLKDLCTKESKQIIMTDFITQNNNDDTEKIKEYYSFIVSRKLKDQYETILFSIDIWNYYIFNKFQFEFLTFLENKLYEQSLNTKELLDCLIYSSHFRRRSLLSMLKIINSNSKKILNIFKNENKLITIESYITQNLEIDDVSKIYEQIKIFIEKEKDNSFCLIKFNVELWKPYSQCENFDTLKLIRKIIKECRKIEPELDENDIDLSNKIHNVGFMYIEKGMLLGEKLLLFLGEDEALYVQNQIKDCVKKNKDLQEQVDDLKSENEDLKDTINDLKSELKSLKDQHSDLSNKVDDLDSKVSNLDYDIRSVRIRVYGLESQ